MTVEELRRYGREVLKPLQQLESLNRVEQAIHSQEVDLLLGAALSCSFTKLVMAGTRPVSAEQLATFRLMLDRRLAHEPVAYIIGNVWFHAIELAVSPEVLIPRPETELVVERAIERFCSQDSCPTLFDVGTGSGAIALATVSALRDKFGSEYLDRGRFYGMDISTDAISIARKNAERLGLFSTVSFHVGDLADPVCNLPLGQPEVIVANLPYISESESLPEAVVKYEPPLALRGGRSGLELVLRLLEQASVRIKEGSILLLEVGSEQYSEIDSRARASGFNSHAFCDLHGVLRVAEVRA